MKEKLQDTSEKILGAEALEKAGSEHRNRLRENLEQAETAHKNKAHHESLDHIQREALERASSLKEVAKTEKSPAEKRSKVFTKQQREASFKRQMEAIELELKPTERRFSHFTHNRSVEKISDALGSTIARPNALLAGSISAFILVTVLYLIAKHYGYQLSGFETVGAFAFGWIIGIIYDYVRLLVSGKQK